MAFKFSEMICVSEWETGTLPVRPLNKTIQNVGGGDGGVSPLPGFQQGVGRALCRAWAGAMVGGGDNVAAPCPLPICLRVSSTAAFLLTLESSPRQKRSELEGSVKPSTVMEGCEAWNVSPTRWFSS